MRIDLNNKKEEVLKLQNFLKIGQGYDVEETGVFDEKTDKAVKAFQEKYSGDVLKPWGSDSKPTGYVYITTKNKINQIVCGDSNLNDVEKKIVDEYVKSKSRQDNGELTPPAPLESGSDSNNEGIKATTTIIGLNQGAASEENKEFVNSNVAIVFGSATSTNEKIKEEPMYCSFDTTPNLIDKTIHFFGNLFDSEEKR
jgi:peptidoglycan hydrolase-like protein with peptidoglycan-binding domain